MNGSTLVYTTNTTPRVREHIMAVEVENDYGARIWSHMKDSEVDAFIAGIHKDDSLSDIDHSARCWCQ